MANLLSTSPAIPSNHFSSDIPSSTSIAADPAQPMAGHDTHPLLSLFAATFWVVWWLLDCARALIAFVTLRLPIVVYAVVSYSFTIRLDFYTIAALAIGALVGLGFYIRFTWLAGHESLKEAPLEKRDAKALHPDVNKDFNEEKGSFSDYLDEFLLAVRVFGFLEKPVFHELARHLQTRRLIAGDTISLDSDRSFYCVMDGTVQVFAQTEPPAHHMPLGDPSRPQMSHSQRSRPSTKSNRAGPSRQPYPRPETYVHSSTTSDLHHWDSDDDESMSSTSGGGGYQLINEVERGGTLSSLFTILSLFTEDVEISWGAQEETGDGMNDLRRFRRKGNSFEDDDHEGITFGRGPGGGQSSTSRSTSDWDIPKLNLPASSASTSPIPQEGTMHAGEVVDSPQAIQGPVSNAQVIIGSPPATPSEAGTARSTASQSNTQIPSSPSTLHNFTPVPHQSRSHSRHRDGYDTDADPYAHEGGRGGRRKETANVNTYKALRGIVARASEDTTLAVIPAEAFRRVTKKFPKASAHIVQVILTRFSRVTFNAAHKYLGLTSELLRAEKAINDMACHPLPEGFYAGGGLEKLRARFSFADGMGGMMDEESEEEEEDVRDKKDRRGASVSSRGGGKKPSQGKRPATKSQAAFDGEDEANDYFSQRVEASPALSSRTLGSASTIQGGSRRHSRRSSSSLATGSGSMHSRNATITADPTTHGPPPRPTVATSLSSETVTATSNLNSATSTNSLGLALNKLGGATVNQAGDLHTTVGAPPDMSSGFLKMNNILATPHPSRSSTKGLARLRGKRLTKATTVGHAEIHSRQKRSIMISLDELNIGDEFGEDDEDGIAGVRGEGHTDFNLRDEVMACIAKSIGLIQPPLGGSGVHSMDVSPILSPTTHPTSGGWGSHSMASTSPRVSPVPASMRNAGMNTGRGLFQSSFGSLSMLGVGFDTNSSVSGSATESHTMGNEYMSGLDNEVEVLFFPAGSPLVKAGEVNAGLFYVIDGFLDISMPLDDAHGTEKENNDARSDLFASSTSGVDLQAAYRAGKGHHAFRRGKEDGHSNRHLFTVKRGGIAGYLSSLSGIASYVEIRAKTDTYVGFLPSYALNRLLERRPIVLLTLSKRLLSLLSPLVVQIDSALDWMHVSAGQYIWQPGDVSHSLYIVINGRLRAFQDTEKLLILGEYGQGDIVGELDVITNTKRSHKLHAIRDTELVRIPLTLFNAISRNPQATVHLLRRLANRVKEEKQMSSLPPVIGAGEDQGRKNFNLKTVAILPATSNVPIVAFSKKLHSTLENIGAPTSYLNQHSIVNHVGKQAFSRMGNLKAAGWLSELEQKYRIVLYVVDSPVGSQWTQTCLRQADYIMLVGLADDPSVGEYERLLNMSKATARRELVLLHPDRSITPGTTRAWLKGRPWVNSHFHVELPGLKPSKPALPRPIDPAAVAALKKVKESVQSQIQKYRGGTNVMRPPRPDHVSDFARLARRLCGRTIGVVLGGGGARGISHLGVLRALEDYGIPIDHVGGTSIGAFVGGLYAHEGDILAASGRAKSFAARMGSIWRMLADVTYPIVAYTTGHAFNRTIFKSFNDLYIEDMWIPFFCNSTNILRSRMEIHESGYAWRYIRASMTLVGLLPPLCDNGEMLVDGGYMDNLPVSAMFNAGAHSVFAVDVGAVDDTTPRKFGDSVSGWWLLLNRWNPFSRIDVPPITEIQSRLAYVSSVKTLEEAKNTPGCLYMRIPVEHYGTLQWNMNAEIQGVGYDAALQILAQWDQEHKLPAYCDIDHKATQSGRTRKGRGQRRNSI